ncbi:MAG: hypothetical protein P8176_14450 [Gammaproteobacteria bacterium]
MALRNRLPEFLVDKEKTDNLAKFIVERQKPNMLGGVGIAA